MGLPHSKGNHRPNYLWVCIYRTEWTYSIDGNEICWKVFPNRSPALGQSSDVAWPVRFSHLIILTVGWEKLSTFLDGWPLDDGSCKHLLNVSFIENGCSIDVSVTSIENMGKLEVFGKNKQHHWEVRVVRHWRKGTSIQVSVVWEAEVVISIYLYWNSHRRKNKPWNALRTSWQLREINSGLVKQNRWTCYNMLYRALNSSVIPRGTAVK